MKKVFSVFARLQDGYILLFSLFLLPVFVGFGLLIVDIGRGNNAHGDLQAAADAVALAGARELDGSSGAITRARTAMGNLTNNVSMLTVHSDGQEIELVYGNGGTEIRVAFLEFIPGDDNGPNVVDDMDDDDPIDQAFINTYATTDPTKANYVYVAAQARDLETAFLNPINLLRETVPIGATAVATTTAAVCELTPMYVCNPFENTPGYEGDALVDRYNEGALHARIFKLHPKGNGTHTPGNFSFLQVESANGNTSASANELRQVFAGRRNPTCYEGGKVTTKPGAAVAIRNGINTKFDIYEGNFNSYNGGNFGATGQNVGFPIHPSVNVRKGFYPGSGAQGACNATQSDDHLGNADGTINNVYGFPDNDTMTPPGATIPGATVGSGPWDIEEYWQVNFGTAPPQAVYDEASFDSVPYTIPSGANAGSVVDMPSRYDVYRYEIDESDSGGIDYLNMASGGGEVGTPMCAAAPGKTITSSSDPDPRLVYAAIIDCNDPNALAEGGGINDYVVKAYAEMFMVRPMQPNGSGTTITYTDTDGNTVTETHDGSIDVEFVRITGAGANGALENFIRQEAILVR